MGKVFRGQTALRITVRTFCDLSRTESVWIRYRKPDKTGGEFTAAVEDEEKGIIFYDCKAGDIDVSGWWVFWAFVTFDDGSSAAGEVAKVFVWREGR